MNGEDNYQFLFDANPQPMWIYDVDTLRFLAVNNAAIALYGYSLQEFMAMTMRDIRPPEDLANFQHAIHEINETLYTGTWRHRRKDQTVVWVEVASHSLIYQDHKARLLVAHDVTQRKIAEEALADERNVLRTLIDNIPDCIYVKDTQSRFIINNTANACLLNAAKSQEVIGRTDYDFHPPNLASQYYADEQRVIRTGIPIVNREELSPVRDGKPMWVSTTKVPFRDQSGAVIGLVGIGRDITDQKLAERKLAESEQRYRSLFEHHGDAVYSLDLNGRFVSANNSCEILSGYALHELLHTSCNRLVVPEDLEKAQSAFALAVQGKPQNIELTILHKTGRRVEINVMKVPIIVDNEVVGIYGISQDITERKALEQEREQLLIEAMDRADRDPLTGLLNHRAFHKRLKEEMDRALHHETAISIILVDLDNFKYFNDTYGHIVGDDVLRQVAQALNSLTNFIGYEAIARFGGDEFALLLPGISHEQVANTVSQIETTIDGIRYLPPGTTTPIPLTFSFGIATLPEDGFGRLDLLATADARLLRAKCGWTDDERAEQLRQLLTSTVEGFSMLDALVTAVDNKDRYTRRHSEDVMTYCLEIAQELGLDESVQQQVQIAALLHDVGKIGVPDYILRKPGSLTEQEYQAVKQHPMMGAIMVAAIPGFEGALDATRHHHERWDGNGYPFGLRGEETPLLARVMAVADAFSAMTTDRPYRKGMHHEHALSVLEEGAGKQWDPKCVGVFLRARRNRPITVS